MAGSVASMRFSFDDVSLGYSPPRVGVFQNIAGHSYRSASIGSTAAARRAGYQPKKTPVTVANVNAANAVSRARSVGQPST